MKFTVRIRAEDGTHTKRFTSAKGLRTHMESQLGNTLEAQHQFQFDDGEGAYKRFDFERWTRRGTSIRFVDGWGRSISMSVERTWEENEAIEANHDAHVDMFARQFPITATARALA